MTQRERHSFPTVVGVIAIVVAMLLLYHGVSFWKGIGP